MFRGIINSVESVLKEKGLEVISVSGTEECIEIFKSIQKGEVTNTPLLRLALVKEAVLVDLAWLIMKKDIIKEFKRLKII